MEAFRRFATRLAASIGRGIALIAFGTCTIAHAQLLTLAQHLAAVNAAPASQYVGKAPYKVVSAAEFGRMKDYIKSQYVGVQSVHVFAYDEDLIVDCVDQFTQLGATRHGLNTGNWKTAPTHLPRLPDAAQSYTEPPLRDPGVFLMRTDTDAYGNLRGCLPGSIPVNRLTLDMIAIFPTLADYDSPRTLPSAYDKEYAKASLGYTNAGGEAYIYNVNPYVEDNSEASIMQLWVVAGGSNMETIEAGWDKDHDLWFWDKDYPHLFILASKNSYGSHQWNNGSWFVQTDHSVNLGGKLTLSSVPGGSQYSTKFYIYQDGAKSTGDWWVSYDGVWVGYYPYTEFSSPGLRDGGWLFDAGGEIHNVFPSGRHTKTDMGSGYQPSAGWQYAAYMRMIRYVDTSNTWVIPTYTGIVRDDADCYNAEAYYNGGPGWESYIYLGGEGYNSQTCP
jgi:hypothetical protein